MILIFFYACFEPDNSLLSNFDFMWLGTVSVLGYLIPHSNVSVGSVMNCMGLYSFLFLVKANIGDFVGPSFETLSSA